MKKLIVIPTYNEKNNISVILKKIVKLYKSKFQILVIDDNSPDGTADEVIKISKRFQFIKLYLRNKKLGIGSAHKFGIKYAVENNFKILITMDSDGTHNPKYIKKLISLVDKYDLVTTTRFLNKKSLNGWPFYRKVLTKIRHYILKFFLKIEIDASGAFRCYDLNKINFQDILLAKDNGYSFFWESIYILCCKKYKIREIPVNLPYRSLGSSKMKIRDVINALVYVIKISMKKI